MRESFDRELYMAESETTAVPPADAWRPPGVRPKLILGLGVVIVGALLVWMGRILHIPTFPGRAGSLLQQDSWTVAIVFAWAMLVGGTLIASTFASRWHYEGGLVCACLGLAILSWQLGPMRFALFGSSGPKVFWLFIVETVLLGAGVALAWWMVQRAMHAGVLPKEYQVDSREAESDDERFIAMAAQIIIMLLLMLLLGQTDAKLQTLASVGGSAYVAALAAHQFFPVRPSIYFWIGPLVLGIFGYFLQTLGSPLWLIGDVSGFFAPLARPLPIDYASVGVAGSILGYWSSQNWHRGKAELSVDD
jgi:hypothetical protein